MKKTLLILSGLFLSIGAYAQSDALIAEYQANNPEKLIMTHENYDLLDTTLQALIASTVVFKEDIGNGIFGNGDLPSSVSSNVDLTDVNFIKTWIAEHQDLKIVTRLEYDASRPDVQAMYDQPHILVLIGNELTKQDILNF